MRRDPWNGPLTAAYRLTSSIAKLHRSAAAAHALARESARTLGRRRRESRPERRRDCAHFVVTRQIQTCDVSLLPLLIERNGMSRVAECGTASFRSTSSRIEIASSVETSVAFRRSSCVGKYIR